jgi:hypothetical protein
MGIEEKMAAIGRFLSQEVFFGEEEDLAVVDEVFDPEVVFSDVPRHGDLRGTDAISAIKKELREHFQGREGEIAIRAQIGAGNLVATSYTLEVYEESKYEGITVSRFTDGNPPMIKEYRVEVAGEGSDRKTAHN